MRRLALALILGCLLLVAGASALDGYGYYQTIEYAACDQDVYQQDIVIHRSTGTAYNETAGGLETWHIFVGEHCREDYGDIRFTNSAGAELAYYLWPDYDNSSARFAVRLEGATSAGQIQVWYGNPAAATTSDGGATYFLHDHFDGSVIDAKNWLSSGASVSGGYCTMSATGSYIRSTATYGSGTAVQFRAKYTMGPNQWIGYYPGHLNTFYYIFQTSSVCYANSKQDGAKQVSPFGGTAHTFTISRSPSDIRYHVDGVLQYTVSAADTSGIPISGTVYSSGSGYLSVDYVLVRAYSATPPAALTFSGEQETAAPPATAFPGLTLIPRDLAGNGLYTDINGNNRLDYNDLTVFFQNLAWAKTNQPTECFDFNANSRLDYADVISLFQVIKNA